MPSIQGVKQMKPFSCATDDSDKKDGVFVSALVFLRSKPNLRPL
jgi:hypothetical protein